MLCLTSLARQPSSFPHLTLKVSSFPSFLLERSPDSPACLHSFCIRQLYHVLCSVWRLGRPKNQLGIPTSGTSIAVIVKVGLNVGEVVTRGFGGPSSGTLLRETAIVLSIAVVG